MNKRKIKQILTKFIIYTSIFLSLILLVFYIYTLDYYKAEPIALEVLEKDSDIEEYNEFLALVPKESAEIGIIFYQGGKVENYAYLPLLQKLKNEGYISVLTKAPFNLAIFDKYMADEIYDYFPEVDKWYIMGHSLGGVTASMYAEENQDKINGLILLGAYIYGNYPDEKSLTVYGEFNSNLEEKFYYENNIVEILGGNHAYFGNYGEQKGDAKATITQDEQQNETVEAIKSFISLSN